MNNPSSKPTPATQSGTSQADLTMVGGGGHAGIRLVLAFAETGMKTNRPSDKPSEFTLPVSSIPNDRPS